MDLNQTYGVSARGLEELRRSATTLPPAELELLVRIDGTLTLAQVRAAMPPRSDAEFSRIFNSLCDRGLVERVQLDTFALQMRSELDNLAVAQGANEADADAGLRSLKRSGYLVNIARRPPGVPPANTTERRLTAVVVEDDANLSRFLGSYLGFHGFQVRTAGDRTQVLEQFRQPPVPDLVLLDVMLPDIDGFDILASLRRHPAFARVPVIMLTGKATREAVLKGLTGGADGYLTKPFEPEALMTAVRTVLALPPKAA